MDRSEILTEVKKYFTIDEVVCNHTLAKWGEEAWRFIDTDALHVLLVLRRDIFQVPMWCNNHKKGVYQRGLRCNMCQLVREKSSVYLSAHCLGKGFDLTVQGYTAEQARNKVKEKCALLPCRVRMEKGVTWLHIDVTTSDKQKDIIYEFSAN